MITEEKVEDLKKDFDIILNLISDDDSYGIRNIHDRIHFLLTNGNYN